MVKKTIKDEATAPQNERTVKFSPDGPDYKVSELPDKAKELFARWEEKKVIRDNFIIKANNDIDDLNRVLASYEADMKTLVETDKKEKN
jgi:hypothetical protein